MLAPLILAAILASEPAPIALDINCARILVTDETGGRIVCMTTAPTDGYDQMPGMPPRPTLIISSIEPNVERVVGQDGFDNTDLPQTPCQQAVSFGVTLAIESIPAAVDLWTTELVLRRNRAAYETNPLGFSTKARIATKVLMIGGGSLADWKLRKAGHTRAANFTRAIVFVVQLGLVVNNLDIAYSK